MLNRVDPSTTRNAHNIVHTESVYIAHNFLMVPPRFAPGLRRMQVFNFSFQTNSASFINIKLYRRRMSRTSGSS
jgi:hypothetical protein